MFADTLSSSWAERSRRRVDGGVSGLPNHQALITSHRFPGVARA